jgi:hypothetical protein
LFNISPLTGGKISKGQSLSRIGKGKSERKKRKKKREIYEKKTQFPRFSPLIGQHHFKSQERSHTFIRHTLIETLQQGYC